MERKTIENDLEFLKQISLEVETSNDKYKEMIKNLDEFCQKEDNLMALAAIQIGIPYRIIYLKKTDLSRIDENYNERTIMINPVILKQVGLTKYYEACASCLDYTALVSRPYLIEIEYLDEKLEKHKEIIEGFKSTVISHEIDHLNGILHMDKAEELLILDKDKRKKLREIHPYEIIRKEGPFIEKKLSK